MIATRPRVAGCRLMLTVTAACGAFTAGCAPKALYDWGRYEESLQANYIAHDDARAWASLEATLTSAQKTGHRAPPGTCAEYGFALYKRGDRDRAVEYFQREAQLFPESKLLMDKLIAKIRAPETPEAEPPSRDGAEQ